MELILDSNRNALLALDLKVSILTMGIGVGTLVAGVFGMNVRLQNHKVTTPPLTVPFPHSLTTACCEQLKSHFEEHEFAFYAMTATAFAASMGAAWLGVHRCVHVHAYAHIHGLSVCGLWVLLADVARIGYPGSEKLGCQAITANDRRSADGLCSR